MKPDDISSVPVIVYERNNKIFGKRNSTVIFLTLVAILMFATSSFTKQIFGDISIISLTFVAVMFGTGMLTEVDFNSLSWHTLFLVGGGNILGKAVESSGLLGYIADGITDGRVFFSILFVKKKTFCLFLLFFPFFYLICSITVIATVDSAFLYFSILWCRSYLYFAYCCCDYSTSHNFKNRNHS